VNLATNEEEEDSVRRDNEQTRDKESQESSQVVSDPALSTITVCDGTILNSRSDTNAKSQRKSPAENVIPFLKELRLSVSSHDHLIEVECNAESPAEIGNEEEVHKNGHRYARSFVLRDRIFIGCDESRETNNNTNAEITN
jgi:hypothetical protein